MGKTIKSGIHMRNILNLMCIVPLIPIEGLFYLSKSIYNMLFLYLTIVDAMLIFCRWILCFTKRKKINTAAVCLFVLAILNILLTIWKHGDKRGVLGVWLYTVPLIMLLEINKDHLYDFLRVILFYLESLIAINLILVLIRPNGLYSSNIIDYGKMWILGYKSSLQCYVFPAIVISMLFFSYGAHKKNTIFLFVISHVVCIAESNGMLLIGLAIIDLVFFTNIYQKRIVSRKIIIYSFLGIVVANVIIVLFTNMFLSNSAVQYVTYSLLGKNSTLSMRTANWAAVWPAIKANPLLGYGYTSTEVRTILYGRETAHAHNLFLELLYENGMMGLIVFAFFNFVIIRKVYKHFKTNASRIVFFALVVFYIMYIFENVFQKSSAFIWLIFMFGYYSKYIDMVFTNPFSVKKKGLNKKTINMTNIICS